MKKFEVKKVGITSLFKSSFYIMLLPSVLFFLMGIVMALAGIVFQESWMIIWGVVAGMLYPVLLLGFAGLLYMLMGAIYNLFAGKFGGLVLTLEEKEPYMPQGSQMVAADPTAEEQIPPLEDTDSDEENHNQSEN